MITNLDELRELVGRIDCSVGGIKWSIFCGNMSDGFYLQLRYMEDDIEDPGRHEEQRCRKWYVSRHSTKSEVVQTVLKACLTSAEHMVREHFLYAGKRIFSPHLDLDRLVAFVSGSDESRRVEKCPVCFHAKHIGQCGKPDGGSADDWGLCQCVIRSV